MSGINRRLGLVLILALVVAQSSFAARRRAGASLNESVRQTVGGNPIVIQTGLGLVSGFYSLGVSLNAGGVMRVSDAVPIYAGIDTMLTIGSTGAGYGYGYYTYGTYYGTTTVGVGILGTAYYKFTIPKQPRMHVVGGLSTGPLIAAGGVWFSLLVRPGFTWDMTNSISITGEPMFGIVGPGWVFTPRALLSFHI